MRIGILTENPRLGVKLNVAARVALNALPPRKAEQMVKTLRGSTVNLRNGRKDKRVRPFRDREGYFEVRLDPSHSGIIRRQNGDYEVDVIWAKA